MKKDNTNTNGKKKILFVTNTMGRAGAEKCLQALLELLDPQQYDMSVYSIINRGELYDDMPDYVHILNKKPCNQSVLDNAGLRAITRQILWSLLKKFSFITYIPYFFRILAHQIKTKHLDFSKLFWMLLARNAKRFDEEYDLAVAFIEGAATYYVAKYVKAKKKATYVHIDYLAAGYLPKLDKPYYDKFDRVFCVSDTVRQVFLKAYPEYADKTFFFHNMVPRERILRLAKGQGLQRRFRRAENSHGWPPALPKGLRPRDSRVGGAAPPWAQCPLVYHRRGSRGRQSPRAHQAERRGGQLHFDGLFPQSLSVYRGLRYLFAGVAL